MAGFWEALNEPATSTTTSLSTARNMTGLTPGERSCGQHTAGVAACALHGDSTSVLECLCAEHMSPDVTQGDWAPTHHPGAAPACRTSTQAYLMLTLECQKAHNILQVK